MFLMYVTLRTKAFRAARRFWMPFRRGSRFFQAVENGDAEAAKGGRLDCHQPDFPPAFALTVV